jgi:hypothetical protein
MEVENLKVFISERFVNAVGDRDIDIKRQYAKQVFDLLTKSYAGNGGLFTNGFQDLDTMVEKIPMWKMVVNNGTVEAVVMYKDKGGRKSVAMGSTGSPYAKKAISNLFPAELQRSYGEKSKSALGALMKIVPWSVLEPYAKTPAQVKKVSKDTITSLKDFKGTLPDDAKATLTKFPVLQPYGYFREIGGKLSFKVMIGTPGKTIK